MLLAILRNERSACCCCDKCGALSWQTALDLVEQMLEALARRGWRFLDPQTGQPEALCATCMKAEPRDA